MTIAEHTRRLLSACAAAALLTALTPTQAAEPASRAKTAQQAKQAKRVSASPAPKAAAKVSKSSKAPKPAEASKAARVARATPNNEKPTSRRLARNQVKEEVAARAGKKPKRELTAHAQGKKSLPELAKLEAQRENAPRVTDAGIKPLTRKQALADAARRFAEADLDGNGVLSPTEQVAMHKAQYKSLQAQYQLSPGGQPIPQAAVTAALSSLQEAKPSRSELEGMFTPLPAAVTTVADATASVEEAKPTAKARPGKQPLQDAAVGAASVARGATEKALSFGEALINKGAEVLGQKEQTSRGIRTARLSEPPTFRGTPLAPWPESLPRLPTREDTEIPKPTGKLRYPVEMRSH